MDPSGSGAGITIGREVINRVAYHSSDNSVSILFAAEITMTTNIWHYRPLLQLPKNLFPKANWNWSNYGVIGSTNDVAPFVAYIQETSSGQGPTPIGTEWFGLCTLFGSSGKIGISAHNCGTCTLLINARLEKLR